MAIQLTQEQTTALQNLHTQQNYPAAYSYVADIVRNTPGADQRLAAWLDDATHINANDGGLISEYVRDATWETAYDQGQLLTRDQFMVKFQDASNFFTDGVLRSIV